MGKANLVTQIFTGTTNWTCPGGVNQITVHSYKFPYVDKSQSGLSSNILSRVDGPTYVIDSFQSLWAWGPNGNGQLGNGSVTPTSSPVAVLGGFTFSDISANPNGVDVIALSTTGQVYGWGSNTAGVLGVGNLTPHSSPVAVVGGLKFVRIRSSGSSSFGITQSGATYAWGLNSVGQLGIGTTSNQSSPILVLGALYFSNIITTGLNGLGSPQGSILGLTNNNQILYGWGANENGQLGLGDVIARSSPVAVLGGLSFQFVQMCTNTSSYPQVSTYGLTTSGVLYAWGYNGNGQLGLGDVIPRSSPVAVLGGLTFTSFTAGLDGSIMAITSQGVGYAWGYNGNGQLGLGDVIPRSSPVAVLGGLKWFPQRIYKSSSGCTYGIISGGVGAYAWGNNADGELGIGNLTSQSSPVAVVGGSNFQHIIGDTEGTLAGIDNTGLLWGWGINGSGNANIGNGNLTEQSSPVAVLGGISSGNLIIANLSPSFLSTTVVSVIPGTTYVIQFNQQYTYIGTTLVGNGSANSIKIEYFQ